MNSDLGMQSNKIWKELVQQVKEGARPEDALGLREQEENLSALGSIVPNSDHLHVYI